MSVTQVEYEQPDIIENEEEYNKQLVYDTIQSVVLYGSDVEINAAMRDVILSMKRTIYDDLYEMVTHPRVRDDQSGLVNEKIPDRYVKMSYDKEGNPLFESKNIKGQTLHKASLIKLARQKELMHGYKAEFRKAIEEHDGKRQRYVSYKSSYARIPIIKQMSEEDMEKEFFAQQMPEDHLHVEIRMDTKEMRSDKTPLMLHLRSSIKEDDDYSLMDYEPNPELSVEIRKIAHDALGKHAKEKLRDMGISEVDFSIALTKIRRIIMRDMNLLTESGDMIITGKFTLMINNKKIDVVAKLSQVDMMRGSAEMAFIITAIEVASSEVRIVATSFPWMPIEVLKNLRSEVSEELRNKYFSQVMVTSSDNVSQIVDEELTAIVHGTEPWSMLNHTKLRKWILKNTRSDTTDELQRLQRDSATMVTIFRGSLEYIDVERLFERHPLYKIELSEAFDKLIYLLITRRGTNKYNITETAIPMLIKRVLVANVGISVQEAEIVRMMIGTNVEYERMLSNGNKFTLMHYKSRAMLALLTRVYSRSILEHTDQEQLFDYISGSDLQLTSLPYCMTEKNIFLYEVGPEMIATLIDYKVGSKMLNKLKASRLTSKSDIRRTGTSGYIRVASFKAALIEINTIEQRRKHRYTMWINNKEVALTEIIANCVKAIYRDLMEDSGAYIIWHPKFAILFIKYVHVGVKTCEAYIIPSSRPSRIQKPLHN